MYLAIVTLSPNTFPPNILVYLRNSETHLTGIFLDDPEIAEIMNFLNYLISPNNLRFFYDLCITYNFPPKDLAILFESENPIDMMNQISKVSVDLVNVTLT